MAVTNDLIIKLCPDNSTVAKTYRPLNTKRVSERVTSGKAAVLNVRRGGNTGTVGVYGVDLANPWKGNNPVAGPFPGASLQQNTWVGRGDGITQTYLTSLAYVAPSNFNWMLDLHQFDRYVLDQTTATISAGFTITSGAGALAQIGFATDSFTGDGATLAFTGLLDFTAYSPGITSPPSSPGGYIAVVVTVNGVQKVLGTDYTIDSNGGLLRVTFVVAPPNTQPVAIKYAPANGMEFGLSFVAPVTILAPAAGPFILQEIRSYDRLWAVLAAAPSSTSVAIEPIGKG